MSIVGLRLPKKLKVEECAPEENSGTLTEWRQKIISETPDSDEVKRFIIAMDKVYSSCRTTAERRNAESKKLSDF